MTSVAAFPLQTRSMATVHTSIPLRASASGDDDDKYAKVNGQKIGSAFLRDFNNKDVAAFMQSPFQLYLGFLMAGSVIYYLLGGNLMQADAPDLLGYLSTICETLGLLVLQYKIKSQGSVKGISGMTMAMYALVFVSREYLLMPVSSWLFIDGWAVEVLQLPSILITFNILYSIFRAHKDTYQKELDVLHLRYLVPSCVALAIILHPHFVQGEFHSFLWTSYLYLDVCSLLPQVVMMARSGGKVEAPIAHFVAATAFRWVIDLWFWYFDFDLGPQGWYKGVNVSGCLIVAFHILSLGLVADFMYYYIKARFSGSRLSDDLDVGAAIEV
jgi:hypothetical protein